MAITETALDVVRKWHEALNSDDVDKLVALVTEDVEVGGPRGITSSAQVVREWFGRANLHLYPLRYYMRDHVVVVEEQAQWHSPEGYGTQLVATIFEVNSGLISRIIRYTQLAAALDKADLDEKDLVEMDVEY